jgi:hypothetical protein
MLSNQGFAATIIVATTGDRGPLLRYSVGSILAQTEPALEVFVIGDGTDTATREAVREMSARDARVRFFDHPKHPRRGEEYRHAALAEARGEIVCYLTDRDYMLPNHVTTMARLLADADFAHTARAAIQEDGSVTVPHMLEVELAHDRELMRANPRAIDIPLSFAAHTLAMYRRLPYGWRRTPRFIFTDMYMWHQFLDHPECRTVASTVPTILYFSRGTHPGWPTPRRLAELEAWHARATTPGWYEGFSEEVHRQLQATRRNQRPPKYSTELGEVARRLGWRRAVGAMLPRSIKTFIRHVLRENRPPPAMSPRTASTHISDSRSYPIQDHVRLDVYWVGEAFGPGPGASLYVYGDEVLRFDCFGGRAGHLHINLRQSQESRSQVVPRLYFPEGTIQDHIERAAFELKTNVPYCTEVVRDPRIRAVCIDPSRLGQAADLLRERMLTLFREKCAASETQLSRGEKTASAVSDDGG